MKLAAASETNADALRESGVRILDLNDVATIPTYVDGEDEICPVFALLKTDFSSPIH